MRTFAIALFKIAVSFGFIVVIAASAVAGFYRARVVSEFDSDAWVGLLIGGLFGLMIAGALFGAAFLLIDLADNTRHIRQMLEDKRRTETDGVPVSGQPAKNAVQTSQ